MVVPKSACYRPGTCAVEANWINELERERKLIDEAFLCIESQIPIPLFIDGLILTTGDIAVGPFNTLLPGTLLPFVVSKPGLCKFEYVANWAGNNPIPLIQTGLRIDFGIDYNLATTGLNNGAGADTCFSMPQSGSMTLFLLPGPHVVQVIAAQFGFPGFTVQANPTYPLTLSVIHP